MLGLPLSANCSHDQTWTWNICCKANVFAMPQSIAVHVFYLSFISPAFRLHEEMTVCFEKLK